MHFEDFFVDDILLVEMLINEGLILVGIWTSNMVSNDIQSEIFSPFYFLFFDLSRQIDDDWACLYDRMQNGFK